MHERMPVSVYAKEVLWKSGFDWFLWLPIYLNPNHERCGPSRAIIDPTSDMFGIEGVKTVGLSASVLHYQ
jgi:hypothetical protein